MKKIILFLLSINLLWAFPPDAPYFNELLSDNGKMTKNTLKLKKLDGGTYSAYFYGEVTLTGVLERADDFDTNNALRFYPDNNIDLPILSGIYSDNIDDYKEFERLDFSILLDDKNVNLPSPLNKAFLGVSAVRAEVTIRNYSIYCEGEEEEAYGELVNFKLLGDIKTEYFTKDNSACVDYDVGNRNAFYIKLKYNSKDDYVNIRDKANGKIIGKILKNDMINNDGLLLLVDSNGKLSDWEKNWIEVYYLPPDDNDGKGTIHGFVHGSQINRPQIHFHGEVTLTGLLERSDDFETNNALRFYPDNNDDDKEFVRLDFGILLDDKNVNLPSPLNKAFLGVSAVRAEVTIREYSFYGEGEAGEAYGELVNFKLLGDIKTEYFTKDNYDTLEYNSKDDYVNIRDKANGKIIGKILKNDMINNEGLLLLVDSNGDLSDWEKNWIEVYYLLPDDNDGKGTIHGFVHGSQIKLENGGY